MYICDEITAIFAHEIKNPISLIKANIELLELDCEKNGYEKNLSVMKREIDKINNIITDLLIFSRPIDKNELKNINIMEIIEKNIDDIVTSGIGTNISFLCDDTYNSDEISILARPDKINIVIHNIYKNAIEAIENKGTIYAKINIENDDIILDIVDDGVGMHSDIENKVYKPFTTNKKGGSGLGVYICRHILEEIGGNMELFNNEDRGCTARLIFKKANSKS